MKKLYSKLNWSKEIDKPLHQFGSSAAESLVKKVQTVRKGPVLPFVMTIVNTMRCCPGRLKVKDRLTGSLVCL